MQNTGDLSARLKSSANLELLGTFDQPVLSGDMELDRGGEFRAFGKRYTVTQGTIYFNNPSKIEFSYDIEAETRVRVPGETYRITVNVRGSGNTLDGPPVFTADPPLSNPEIYALLISDVPPGQDSRAAAGAWRHHHAGSVPARAGGAAAGRAAFVADQPDRRAHPRGQLFDYADAHRSQPPVGASEPGRA